MKPMNNRAPQPDSQAATRPGCRRMQRYPVNKKMKSLKFDVFGRYVLVVEKEDGWGAFYLGSEGKRQAASGEQRKTLLFPRT